MLELAHRGGRARVGRHRVVTAAGGAAVLARWVVGEDAQPVAAAVVRLVRKVGSGLALGLG